MSQRMFVGVLLTGFFLFGHSAQATSLRSWRACDYAATAAAQKTGVPREILLTITRVETGRTRKNQIEPWPWTLNVEGRGYWFKTKSAALKHAEEQRKKGIRNFDVGCFQINHRWHGAHFSSLEAMLDPASNAIYAARYLKSLFQESLSWHDAVGAFHSRTEKYAKLYKIRYQEHFAKLPKNNSVRGWLPRNNNPLFDIDKGILSLGSLVPVSETAPQKPFIPQLN